MENRYYCIIETPLGPFTATGSLQALSSLKTTPPPPDYTEKADTEVFDQTRRWLRAYFAKEPLPALPVLALEGSIFQKAVWQQLMSIPYGQTSSYGAIARRLGSSARAVGGAVGRNPIWILCPCHRVLGADGRLTGFRGGLPMKRALLRLEGIAWRENS